MLEHLPDPSTKGSTRGWAGWPSPFVEAAECCVQASSMKQQASSKQQALRNWALDSAEKLSNLVGSGSLLPAPYHQPPTTYHLLPATYYLLPINYHPPLVNIKWDQLRPNSNHMGLIDVQLIPNRIDYLQSSSHHTSPNTRDIRES